MNETKWLACRNPQPMLSFLNGRASERKLRLFAVACCRRGGAAGTAAGRGVLAVVERFADGLASREELAMAARKAGGPARSAAAAQLVGGGASASRLAGEAAGQRAYGLIYACYTRNPAARARAIRRAVKELGYPNPSRIDARDAYLTAEDEERKRQTVILRDLFGNPFRPIQIDQAWLRWNAGTVIQLARLAYDERALPSGLLDTGRLALLADALEDAGCPDAEMLQHLRGSASHARGCWVVDAILSKDR
jgi:hypothetical protein